MEQEGTELKPFKIYWAAPLFTEAHKRFNLIQAEIIKEEMKLLYDIDVEIWLPQHYQVFTNGEFDMRLTFERDYVNILNSDMVVAVLDNEDTGTAWEIGFAYGQNIGYDGRYIPILGYSTDIRLKKEVGTDEMGINGMLRCSVYSICDNIGCLVEKIKEIYDASVPPLWQEEPKG